MLNRDSLRRHGPLIAFGAFMCLMSSVGQTYFISLFGGEIRGAFALSHGEFGTLYMIGTLASAATLIWFGRIVDHLSLKASALIVLTGLAAVAAFTGFVWSTASVALAIYGLRLFGQGMSSHVGITAMARYFTAARGRAVSAASLGHAAGAALSPALVVFLLGLMDWREAWLAVAVLVLALIPAIWPMLSPLGDTRPPRHAAAGEGIGIDDPALSAVLRDAGLWLRLPALMAPAFISTGFVFHQVHLAEEKGWELGVIAGSFSAWAVASVLGLLVTGIMVDRFSARRLVPLFLAPLALACAVLPAGDAPLIAPVFLALMGFNAGGAAAILGSLWAELYGTRHLGAIKSAAASFMVCSTGLAPAVMGSAIDAGAGMGAIAVVSGGYCVAASALALFARKPALGPAFRVFDSGD